MYDQNFKNQAVKECVNGQPISATARKYDISLTALRGWIAEYKERMAKIGLNQKMPTIQGVESTSSSAEDIGESNVELSSINIIIDGQNITISRDDAIRLMEVFDRFDK